MPTLREYILPTQNEGDISDRLGHILQHKPLRHELIPIENRQLLVYQELRESQFFVIVPGYVNSIYEAEGKKVAECEPIPESEWSRLSGQPVPQFTKYKY